MKTKPMETWMLFALLSMVFAGVTAVLAKYGLESINADLGLMIRTFIIFALVVFMGFRENTFADFSQLTPKTIAFLVASGITAYLSWVYYFRALKEGLVSYVAAIDKGSIVVTLALSFLLLKEPLKPQVLIGAGLVLSGLLVLIWK
ncbi:MAG: EamA family transporter [Flavobacteriaceae bacterium]